ncbi:MAG: glycosyltransferase [Bacteroidales bacterium]|nr:glycosyltransferase [Bacteroidales bacterium]
MKKLLQINNTIRENTSTGRIMREIGEMAISAGWESYIVHSGARDGTRPHSSKLVPVGNLPDLFLHWLATRIFDAHGLVSRRAIRRLIKRIKEIDPDVIQIHNIHGYFLNYPELCSYLATCGKPVFWTVHDCWLYTGHCYHYSSAGCSRWQTGCHDCPCKTRFPASYGLDRSRRNYQLKKKAFTSIPNLTLVVVSGWMKKELSRSFLSEVPCLCIHNGINTGVFAPSGKTGIPDGFNIKAPVYYLAVAAIWLPEKGLEDLVTLSGMLAADEQLVIVGKMTESRKRRLPEGVVAIERTSDLGTLVRLYGGATALVNPTWQDNYPTVNLESISCGTPVVTYRTGGSVESVVPQTGFIVGQGDVKGLYGRLQEIRQQDRDTWRRSCREYALSHFDKGDALNGYIKLYESTQDVVR